jgi:hypothetical protein
MIRRRRDDAATIVFALSRSDHVERTEFIANSTAKL